MKIEQIDLKAYGHFTNQRLTLGGPANFHIICGPNEAGKTTLWRAINGALFGIPERSQDTFLHDAKKLRIGLGLCAKSGDRLAVMRRKGRINTLLQYDTSTGDELTDTVPEERLRDWLGGLSQGLFLAMFSLDHEALVRGGEALAQGKGDAGESLFEAGAGLSSIRTLRTKLDREAEALFKPRASTSAIYKTLSDYDETRKLAKDAAIRPADWTLARNTMEGASKAYEAAKSEQTRLQKEARRLERLSAILPDVAALSLAQQRYTELNGVPELPPSSASERVEAVAKRNSAADTERTATSRLEQRQSDLAAIQINEAILANAESVEAIHHATAGYRESAIQLATAEAAIQSAQRLFDAALKQISSNASAAEALQWIPDATQIARVRALVSSGATLKAKSDADLQALNEKKLAVEQIDAELQLLGQDDGATGLSSYLESIADHGDPEAQAKQLESEISANDIRLDAEAHLLKMPSAATVATTTVPLDVVVQKFKTDEDELQREARSLREHIEKIEDDLAALQGDIKGMEVRGEVPTKEAVVEERSKRNALWLAIRRHFMPAIGESVPTEGPPPAERYEHAVASADDSADGLFADAERATRYAEYKVRESQMQSALTLDQNRAESAREQHEGLKQRWEDLLSSHGVPSLTIAEAPQWITKREALLEKVDANQAKRDEAKQRRNVAQEIRDRITALFQQIGEQPPVTEQLSEILVRARGIAKRHADQITQRALKNADRANAEVTRTHAESAEAQSRTKLEAWQSQWLGAMQAIRLADDACAEEATARIEQFAELEEAHDLLESAKGDRQKAQIQIQDYETRLAEAWQRIHDESLPVGDRSHELLASALYRDLVDTRALQEKRNTLKQQVADDELAVEAARQSLSDAKTTIDRLLRLANCIKLESLELVEGQSARRLELAQELRDIESRLVQSAGLSLAEALSQAQGQDPDAVAEALSDNLQKNEANATLVQKLHEEFLTARQAFDAMDGAASAADAQQKLAQHSARIVELGADYAASRIASAVLAQVIDTYQKRNQGPLIELASKRFAAITAARYTGVVIDYDEEKQILKAVRSDGERLAMDQLSTGRRDQLFLALRLAAIEGHLDKGEPLPIIIDDILIQFDDRAAAATFKVLADLSQRTQVLFLTHHEHLLEVAETAVGYGAYHAHHLST